MIRTRMKLTEAQAFQRKIMRLQDKEDLDLEVLYEMRRTVEDYFQAGFCGVGVYAHFKDKIREAIYEKLKVVSNGQETG